MGKLVVTESAKIEKLLASGETWWHLRDEAKIVEDARRAHVHFGPDRETNEFKLIDVESFTFGKGPTASPFRTASTR